MVARWRGSQILVTRTDGGRGVVRLADCPKWEGKTRLNGDGVPTWSFLHRTRSGRWVLECCTSRSDCEYIELTNEATAEWFIKDWKWPHETIRRLTQIRDELKRHWKQELPVYELMLNHHECSVVTVALEYKRTTENPLRVTEIAAGLINHVARELHSPKLFEIDKSFTPGEYVHSRLFWREFYSHLMFPVNLEYQIERPREIEELLESLDIDRPTHPERPTLPAIPSALPVSPSAPPTSNTVGIATSPPPRNPGEAETGTGLAEPTSRDAWIYQECCARTPYKKIVAELNSHPNASWRGEIMTISGVRQAAKRYADTNGLPGPPARRKAVSTSRA